MNKFTYVKLFKWAIENLNVRYVAVKNYNFTFN